MLVAATNATRYRWMHAYTGLCVCVYFYICVGMCVCICSVCSSMCWARVCVWVDVEWVVLTVFMFVYLLLVHTYISIKVCVCLQVRIYLFLLHTAAFWLHCKYFWSRFPGYTINIYVEMFHSEKQFDELEIFDGTNSFPYFYIHITSTNTPHICR